MRAATSALSPIVVTPDGVAYLPTIPPAVDSSLAGVGDRRVILLSPSPVALYGHASSSGYWDGQANIRGGVDIHAEEARAEEMEQEAKEYVVWTILANGRLLRTRYDIPDSGLTEADVDARIAAYYAAPIRIVNGMHYPVTDGIAYMG